MDLCERKNWRKFLKRKFTKSHSRNALFENLESGDGMMLKLEPCHEQDPDDTKFTAFNTSTLKKSGSHQRVCKLTSIPFRDLLRERFQRFVEFQLTAFTVDARSSISVGKLTRHL